MFAHRNIGKSRGEARSARLLRESTDAMPTLVADLDTPAVVIDLDIVEANITRAQDTLASHGLANRPHIKTHKIPALAQDADGGRRGRHHLPEARRGRGHGGCRRRRRHPAHLQRAGRGQDRAAGRADPAPQAHGGGARQRGGGARAVGGRQAPRRRYPLPDRMRHRLRPQRRAEPAGRARSRARDDAHAEHAVRGADDLPDRQARAAAVARTRAATVQRRRHRGAGRLGRRLARAARAAAISRC